MSTTLTTNGSADPSAETYASVSHEGYTLVIADLPAQTIHEAMKRTLRHVLSNEVASKVASAFDKAAKERINAGDPAWDADEEKAEKEALTTKFRDEFVSQMENGTWGGRAARGPTGPREGSFEVEFRNAINRHIRKLLDAKTRGDGGAVKLANGDYRMANGVVRNIDKTREEFMVSTLPATVKKRGELEVEARQAVELKRVRAEAAKGTAVSAEADLAI